ncbi:hypothetical protein PCANC_14558 [Puccinia coronata f. sp. avenae]|uniref:Uncharacterized protein n=1 Tax=Puccinia coronata f. sp. avenae TaxID=200324 RepID=A0A2N5UJW6_9BASI|nr:hypothetical protein PCANC_14558 [Puccinia coronata f. sp. avenae]
MLRMDAVQSYMWGKWACTWRAGVPDRRAEPARLSGGRAKPARPLDRRAGFARLWAHVSLSIREAYMSRGTLIRVPKYPYKGTSRTLIRVLRVPL